MKKEFFNKDLSRYLPSEINQKDVQVAIRQLSYCSTKKARSVLSFSDAKKLNILPLAISSEYGREVVTVACSKNYSLDLENEVKYITGRNVRLLPITGEDLDSAIFCSYSGDEENIKNAKEKIIYKESKSKKYDLHFRDFNNSNSEINFLVSLVDYAIAKKSSDIHIIPRNKGTYIKLRINGELYEHSDIICSQESHKILANRLKILAKLDINKSDMPQDGSFVVDVLSKEIKIRLSTMPTVYGEKLVLRIQGQQELFSLKNIKLSKKNKFLIEESINKKEGLIIFCGPTGSGKTTSMYACLNELATKNLSIVTIEDPVEIEFTRAEQTSINNKLSYQKALKSMLRQDPDVMLIGEVRDKESAEILFQAALSGHLILTTIHSSDVFQSIMRLKHLGISDSLISEAVKLIVNQRLVPNLCNKCKVIDLESSNLLGFQVLKASSCKYCNSTGYFDRGIITEILKLDSNTVDIIKDPKSIKNTKSYIPIESDLERLLKSGKIDLLTFKSYCYEF